jgi:hypothetical protein
MLDSADVAREAPENLRDDHTRERKRLRVIYHASQFTAGRTGRGAEKIDPDGSIHQNETRFLRPDFDPPFQIPLP